MLLSKSNLLSSVKSWLRFLGLEVGFANSAPTQESILRSLLRCQALEFVADVGANTGQYGLLLRRLGYRGPIISFEPLSAAHETLSTLAARDGNWTVAPRLALGAGPGRTTINVAGNSVSSSLLRMNDRHVEAAPHSVVVGVEEIDIAALDDCIDGYAASAGSGLLKMDTQGYEMEVLRGAHNTLSRRISAVQTELSLVELYDGQPLMLDVCNHLKEYHFSLRYIIPGLKDPIDGKLLQLDGIFVRD